MNDDVTHFAQFSGEHFAALAVIAVVAIALVALLRRFAGQAGEARVRWLVCWALAVVLVASQLAEQGTAVAAGYWSAQETLPLHLCDIAVFVVAIALVGAARVRTTAGGWRQLLYELAWFWGIGGTVQALLTPDLNDPFPKPAYFAYFAEHGAIVAAVVVMTAGLRLRPTRGALCRVWLLTNTLAVPVGVIDALLGANYMFLCGPPKNPSIYDYFGSWPWSLLTLEVVGTGILGVCYAPFWLSDRRSRPPRQ